MVTLATGATRSYPQRGPAPGFRFFLYACAAVALMFLDQRGDWLEKVRYGLAAATYPLQLAVNSPGEAWRWTRGVFEDRDRLRAENAELRAALRDAEARTARFDALERENAQLRGLKTSLPPLIQKSLAGEVINDESSTLRQRLVINRGAEHGVFKGQVVMARGGLIGQTLRVGPWSSEIILVTDPEHAIPVQVQRSGERTLAVGRGDPGTLVLPYLPIQADIEVDDVLVSSGLGGVFPPGFPVAKVRLVRRDGETALAQVEATPLAALDRDREVLFLWFTPAHPGGPGTETPDPAAARAFGFTPVATPAPPPASAPETTAAPAAPGAAATAPAPATASAPATTPAAAAVATPPATTAASTEPTP